MIRAVAQIFGGAWRYVRVCPLLFAVPLAAEFAQHVAEVSIGLYDSAVRAQALEHHPLRMGFGVVKILTLLLTGYWAMRFLGLGEDARIARRADPVAIRLFAWVVAWTLAWMLVMQGATAVGLPRSAAVPVAVALMLISLALEVAISPWKAAAALGNPRIGFLRAFALARGSFWWGVGLFLLTVMPLMIAHYVAFGLALGASSVRLWTLMVLDSMLTAYLCVVIATTVFVTARRMAERHGEALAPA